MNEIKTTTNTNKGFSGFALKYIALISMVLDHIHYFFEYTGRIPIWFSWVGRLAAPLFLFCLIEGFIHTHDRKKYFLKVYVIAAIMGLIQFGFYNVLSGFVRGDGFIPANAMLSSFVILMVVMQGMDMIAHKKVFKGLLLTMVPIVLPYIFSFAVYMPLMNSGNANGLFFANLINYSVLPLHTFIIDGGTMTLFQGMILFGFSYLKNKKIRVYAFLAFEILTGIVLVGFMSGGLSLNLLFFEAYEWMEIFAVPFMLCYNGERGKGNAKFFYFFYPAHVYILYALSILVYAVVK